MARGLQDVPPDAEGLTAEFMATQLALHPATIRARNKLFHIAPHFALI
jgi:hypothetical protein